MNVVSTIVSNCQQCTWIELSKGRYLLCVMASWGNNVFNRFMMQKGQCPNDRVRPSGSWTSGLWWEHDDMYNVWADWFVSNSAPPRIIHHLICFCHKQVFIQIFVPTDPLLKAIQSPSSYIHWNTELLHLVSRWSNKGKLWSGFIVHCLCFVYEEGWGSSLRWRERAELVKIHYFLWQTSALAVHEALMSPLHLISFINTRHRAHRLDHYEAPGTPVTWILFQQRIDIFTLCRSYIFVLILLSFTEQWFCKAKAK